MAAGCTIVSETEVVVVIVIVAVAGVVGVDVVGKRLWCRGLMRHRHMVMVSKTNDASERQSDASENGTGRLASREEWKY